MVQVHRDNLALRAPGSGSDYVCNITAASLVFIRGLTSSGSKTRAH